MYAGRMAECTMHLGIGCFVCGMYPAGLRNGCCTGGYHTPYDHLGGRQVTATCAAAKHALPTRTVQFQHDAALRRTVPGEGCPNLCVCVCVQMVHPGSMHL
jgi:hypothetical protein